MSSTKKLIIAGGPHTGKSTLLEGLQTALSDVYFVPEPAELIIAEEQRRCREDPTYEGVFPTTKYATFAKLAIAKSVELEREIPEGSVAICDRSLVDNIAYARMNRQEHFVPVVRQMAQAAQYSVVLMCDPVGTYRQTAIRTETAAQALEVHNNVVAAYEEFDIPIVRLPAVPVERRVAITQDTLEKVLTGEL